MMLDIEFIRENAKKVEDNAKNKGFEVDVWKLLEVDKKRRLLIQQVEQLRAKRKKLSQNISGKPDVKQVAESKDIKEKIVKFKKELKTINGKYLSLLKNVPNMATDDTPIGLTEVENQIVDEWGEKPNFSYSPKNHWEIAESRGWIDKERAAKVTGARFAYIVGPLAELQFAIIKWVIESLTNQKVIDEIIKLSGLKELSSKPLILVLPPHLINTEAFDAMDRLEPREDRYKIEGEELWLQGSAEHVLGAMHSNEIIDETDLPIRYLGYATSFRKEAGSYGKEMAGIIRMHQFDKLEMEVISTPENGYNEHIFSIALQEYLMQQLNLPYHKLLKCTADIGKPNARGVDLEVWLPGQGIYKETHTADFMTDYQARRLKTRVRKKSGKIELIHTIDATVLALGRTLVGIIENNQTKEGGVKIPNVLQPYMNNRGEL